MVTGEGQVLQIFSVPSKPSMECQEKKIVEDMISNLPAHILHEIMFFLLLKDAWKTRVLSKTWHSAWNSFPVLSFNQFSFEAAVQKRRTKKRRANGKGSKNLRIYQKPAQDFVEYVTETIRFRCEVGSSIQKFHLLVVPKLCSGMKIVRHVDRWLNSVLEAKVEDLSLWYLANSTDGRDPQYLLPLAHLCNSKVLKNLELLGCIMDSGLCSGQIAFSLKKLILVNVFIDDRMLQCLLSACFILEELGIKYCSGFKVLDVSGLLKLHKVDLFTHPVNKIVSIAAPNLNSLYYSGNFLCLRSYFEDLKFKKLKFLNLLQVDAEAMRLCDRVFPLLENVEFCECFSLASIVIDSKQLRSLSIICCNNLKTLYLATESLDHFQHQGENELQIEWIKASDKLKIDILHHYKGNYSTVCFKKAAPLLLNLPCCNVLTVTGAERDQVVGQGRNEGEEQIPTLSCDIRHLRLKILSYSRTHSFALLVERFLKMIHGLLTIFIQVGSYSGPYTFLKLEFRYRKNAECEGADVELCDHGYSSCWRCWLTEVNIVESSPIRNEDIMTLVQFLEANALCLKKVISSTSTKERTNLRDQSTELFNSPNDQFGI